jgi:hypothetical protein
MDRQKAIILFFIYLSVFVNSYVFFKQPFEFYLGYTIFLALIPVFVSRYGFDRNLTRIFLVLLVTGIFNVLVGNDTAALFFKVYLGLLMSYMFYDGVLKEFEFDVESLFNWYLIGCYYISIIGFVQFISFQVGFSFGYDFRWILNKWALAPGGLFGIRINSLLAEPTYLAGVLSPAFFVAIYNLTRKEPYLISKFRGGVIIAIFILSFSALGQMGIFLTAALLMINFGLLRYFFILAVVGFILFNILYENVADFRDRYDSLITLFTEGPNAFKLGKTHGSSFILYNNFVVTVENFKTNFMFGSGIGSHPVAFEKFNIAKGIQTAGFNNNSADANSMLLRLISETGLFGTILFLYIVFKCYVSRNAENETHHWLISNAILVMILLNLFRQGHYFLNGFPFFVLMYYYNYIDYNRHLEANETAELKPEESSEQALS